MSKSNLILILCLYLSGSSLKAALADSTSIFVDVTDICKLVPPTTKILQPGSCTDWVECGFKGQILDQGSCLEGWYFDRNEGKCNKSSHVNCPFTGLSSSLCTPEKNGVFLPHPESCDGFIYCKDGEEFSSSCPRGLNFDPISQSCVYAKDYKCPDIYHTNQSEVCKSVSENVRMVDPKSCKSFKQCSKGVLKTTQCIPGTYFSLSAGLCGPLEDADCHVEEHIPPKGLDSLCGTENKPIVGFLSDNKTCSGYYYCDEMPNGKPDPNPVFNKCPDGKFFDVNSFSCKDRSSIRCVFDRCEGMGNKFANKLGNCSQYTYCFDGVSKSEGSCPENYYFDEKLQSCTKNFVPYLSCIE